MCNRLGLGLGGGGRGRSVFVYLFGLPYTTRWFQMFFFTPIWGNDPI